MAEKKESPSNYKDKIKTMTTQLARSKFHYHQMKRYLMTSFEISEILDKSNDLAKVSQLIQKCFNLHSCIIYRYIDKEIASAAGYITRWGFLFENQIKDTNTIPFYIKGIPDTLKFIKSQTKPKIIPQTDFIPISNNLQNVDKKKIVEFLKVKFGDLLIMPFKDKIGVLLLIKKENQHFSSKVEYSIIKQLSNVVTITLDKLYKAHHDSLGLFNSVYFESLLKNTNEEHGILFIKIRGLSKINLLYTRSEGDNVIKTINKFLLNILHNRGFEKYQSLVTRDYDTFKVFLPGITSNEELLEISKIIYEQLSVEIGRRSQKINPKIGGCLSSNSNDYKSLLNNTNEALHTSSLFKQEDDDIITQNITIFDKNIVERIKKENYVINFLKKFLKNDRGSKRQGKMYLEYQPKINLITGLIDGFEALVRLHTKKYGKISPALFIPLAEEEKDAGQLIRNIDLWVANEVCLQIKQWLNKGYEIPISINISRYHLNNENLIAEIHDILKFNKLDKKAHLLKIEITETGILDIKAVEVLKSFFELGIRIDIDDFATENANTNTLISLFDWIDTIKIDKGYVDNMIKKGIYGNVCLDENGAKSVKRILNMLHGLSANEEKKIKILCEGIEHQLQSDWLLEHGCELIQGFVNDGHPLGVDECEKRLQLNKEKMIQYEREKNTS